MRADQGAGYANRFYPPESFIITEPMDTELIDLDDPGDESMSIFVSKFKILHFQFRK